MQSEHQNVVEPMPRDPFEWVIISIVIGGASLVLSIKNKIDARRDAESAKRATQAEASNRLRLDAIKRELHHIEALIAHTRESGELKIDETATGIARRTIVFTTPEAEETFNRRFDQSTAAIGRINRLLSELDLDGFPLKPLDVEEFVIAPSRKIQLKAAAVLGNDDDRWDRLEAAHSLISDCREFTQGLEVVLNHRSS
jgi:hypothetical protein